MTQQEIEDVYEEYYENFSSSRMPKTGHRVHMIEQAQVKWAPICPIHKKPAIAKEPYDELMCTRWYCIDCIAYALYPSNLPTSEAKEKAKE